VFTQLAGILKDRAVTITASDVGEGKLRVCIVPFRKAGDENAALTAPLMVVGTAAEIDTGLADAITGYVESFTPLSEQTERIRAEREQAAKDDKAKAEEDRKARLAKSGKKGSTVSTPTPVKKPEPAKPALVAETADLFAVAAPAASVPESAPPESALGSAAEDAPAVVGAA
jgi:PRTRC genetic system protein E